jgi:molybdate transport system substrate-binding protein
MKASSLLKLSALAFASAIALAAPAAAQTAPVVAAAADLKFALEEIAGNFRANTGQGVRLNFGSSGNFRQASSARRAVRNVPVCG